jgi:hypothetical protein
MLCRERLAFVFVGEKDVIVRELFEGQVGRPPSGGVDHHVPRLREYLDLFEEPLDLTPFQ